MYPCWKIKVGARFCRLVRNELLSTGQCGFSENQLQYLTARFLSSGAGVHDDPRR